MTRQAMAVTATVWPILFAAVLSPGLKALALFQVERGIRLGVCYGAQIRGKSSAYQPSRFSICSAPAEHLAAHCMPVQQEGSTQLGLLY